MLVAFFASALFGFALLFLYAYEPFVCVMAYTMVFFVMIVLLIAALVINNMYWDNMKEMNALDFKCFTDVKTVGTAQFFTKEYWILYWWWPTAGECGEQFFMM